MKFLLFGTGDYYNRYKKWFEQQEVLALLDNAKQKQHTVIDGIEVLPPEEGIQLEYDGIIILSFHVKTMKEQLIALGVDEQCIYHFYDLHYLLAGHVQKRPIHYFLNAESVIEDAHTTRNSVLLLSNDLEFGGPAIALFHAAKVLSEQGYAVVAASMIDGALRENFIDNNIPIIVDENLQIATMREIEWIRSFSLVLCNTLNFHVFLSERNENIPVIWWLHDARFFYDGVDKNVIGKINTDNMKIASVGPVPEAAVKEFLPNVVCDELLYGVSDYNLVSVQGQDKRTHSDKVRFITIGFLETRKGQDILMQSIRKLPDNVRQQSEFYIVGYNETLFGEQIRSESAKIEEIVFTGNVGREKIHELLSSSDVLICPSRQDPMPTVATEAMMHSVPCILSDATGTAAYIHDEVDGFVVPCGNVPVLTDKIEWCVKNKEQLGRMGKRARKLYEEYFSLSAFENRFMEMIHEVLKR